MDRPKALQGNKLPKCPPSPFCRERPPWRSVSRENTLLTLATERHGGRSLQTKIGRLLLCGD